MNYTKIKFSLNSKYRSFKNFAKRTIKREVVAPYETIQLFFNFKLIKLRLFSFEGHHMYC